MAFTESAKEGISLAEVCKNLGYRLWLAESTLTEEGKAEFVREIAQLRAEIIAYYVKHGGAPDISNSFFNGFMNFFAGFEKGTLKCYGDALELLNKVFEAWLSEKLVEK